MKFDAITIREIRMPLVHFFETSFGRTTQRRILLVSVHGEGLTGWGECTAGEEPFYNEESTDIAWHLLVTYLAPMVVGREIATPRAVPELLARVRGNRMAKAAVESAVWHADAERQRKPLWQLLNGTRSEIACGVSLGIQDTLDQLLGKIETELAAGYRRIKLKVKPGWDVDVLRAVRRRWPAITLSCDANSAYTRDDFDHLKRFDEFGLLMIEQPLWNDDLLAHAQLQRQLDTSLCLDESIRHARDAEAALALKSCRILNVKLGRVGGHTEARRVHDACLAANIPVWCGGMLESGIGRAHNIHMSTLPGFSLPGDVSASKRYWKEDIIEPAVEVSAAGMIAVPVSPGLGYRVREEWIGRLTVRQETIRPQ